MVFTYDKKADSEVLRFAALGVGLGLITGLVYGALVLWLNQPLWVGVGLAVLLFLALFPSAKLAKTLYWMLAILLQMVGLFNFGVAGALIGLGLWFVALLIVPALRYVLQKENIISVSIAAVVAWLLSMLIWHTGLTEPGGLAKAQLLTYVEVGALIGLVFWGLAKIISSSFKQYHFNHASK
jgi:hypothetical protein